MMYIPNISLSAMWRPQAVKVRETNQEALATILVTVIGLDQSGNDRGCEKWSKQDILRSRVAERTG